MRRPLYALAGLALLAGLAAFLVIGPDHGGDAALLRPDDPDEIALGRRVYDAECASCHGADLQGQPDWQSPGADGLMPAPPHDETGHTWHHPDAMLFALTRDGLGAVLGDPDYESGMPAFAGRLSDDEIRAALSFIKSTWPDEIRAAHDEINARAAQ
ncbi:Cytochrome C oxidase, cbb3-type, subunit III [Palleronia salina]|uniref:Cytochrome C oxidase, cbb3-type, subunit III n=1 Tax=Palleronia salina TaxID=313368 RepID=A0A1M6DEU3_9RHOB|nr:cytochrome c [Palleronia salina]SHI71844.1 Cytochrome C oxidase, cbb3-type, subunit III [Palleronia salina]